MTPLFALEPEVAGGWGPHTVVSNRTELADGSDTIPMVTHLHYVFDGWMGDDLLEATPCFVVTARLAAALEAARITGVQFTEVEVATSSVWEQFPAALRERFAPGGQLPEFRRLIPQGRVTVRSPDLVEDWSGDDVCFGIRVDYQRPTNPSEIVTSPWRHALVVSLRCLHLMQEFNVSQCGIEELTWQ